MAIRDTLASWGRRVLGWVEGLGDVLGLAVAAIMLPVGRLVLWLGQFLLRLRGLWRRNRGQRPGPVAAAAAEVAAVSEDEDEDGRQDNGRGPGPIPPPAAEGREQARGFAWKVGALYALAVLCWAVSTVMRRVDSALQQMQVGGESAGSALGFPVSFSHVAESLSPTAAQETVEATRDAWTMYNNDVTRTTVLRDPFEVAAALVRLDRYFIVLYLVLLGVGLLTLGRLNARAPGREHKQRDRRARMLSGAGGALALLVVVDLTEDWQLNRALVKGEDLAAPAGEIALGPLMSLLKVPLALAVVGAGLFVAVSLAAETRPLRAAFVSVRGVAYGVALLVLILMVGIGAAQLDDVIRAWDGWRAAWAVLACLFLSVTVAGVARRLSSGAREHPHPDQGASVQPLLLGTGVVVIAAGQLLRLGGLGWGVSIAGALFVVLWAFGLPVDGLPEWPELPRRLRRRKSWLVKLLAAALGAAVGAALAAILGRALLLGVLAGVVVALAALAGWARRDRRQPDRPAEGQAAGGPEAEEADLVEEEPPEEDPVAVALWGDRIGRALGSLVAAALVVAAARAMALDAYVRKGPSWELIRWPVLGAAATLVVGVGVCAYRSRRVGADVKPLKSAWFPLSILALIAAGWLLVYDNAIRGPQAAGSVAVLLGGFLLFTGVLAMLAEAARRGPITEYALAPALRALRFRRFPVVLFLVVWAFAVSALDAGGYHDIRRIPAAPGTSVAPTIGQAWQQYVQSGPQGGVRPVVLVGAQGGGIRAAVWTALVMECIFGPGPVAGSGNICAEGDTTPDPNRLAAAVGQPLPVFLASGASGGSVGLAAWSARRADLVQDGPSSPTPRTIEEALDRDFVAPDVARLLFADLPHALLAWDFADRAEMLEGAWEEAWHDRYPPDVDPSTRGLGRGLRRTWDVTHAGGAWATPVLAFNGISVEDDCRFLASAIDFTLPRQLPANPADVEAAAPSTADQPNDAACRGVASPADTTTAVDILPSTNELIDYLCPTEDVPLSTAAHISARFPYVSPTGRIHRRACPSPDGLVPEPAISYDADGGIFDNSGSGTAVDTWRALTPLAAATERATDTCVVPIFLQIDNSAGRATISSAADPRPNELTAPIGATMGQLTSREAYSRSGAAAAFERMTSAGGRQVDVGGAPAGSAWFRIVLFGQPGPEPPLGWTLAPETVKDMRSQLRAVPNQEAIGELRRLLTPGRLTCRTP
jgi:hypothetical protein